MVRLSGGGRIVHVYRDKMGRCVFGLLVYTNAFTCVLCLCVHAAHHRLLGDVHQLLNVVMVVLFKGGEEHIQHHLTLCPHHLPL